MEKEEKKRAGRNRTITLSAAEQDKYKKNLIRLTKQATVPELMDKP